MYLFKISKKGIYKTWGVIQRKKNDPHLLCFNRLSKSYLTISINTIYESSNFFRADLIHPAIYSRLYFTAISLPLLQ